MNQFGGYKIINGSITMDLWLLEDTWAFKNSLVPISESGLLSSVFLNIDAYAYNYTKQYFVDMCDSIPKPKEIDIVLEDNPNKPLNCIRALVYAQKYNLNISKRLLLLINSYFLGNRPLFEEVQMQHFKKIMIDYKKYINCERIEL